MYRKLTLTRGSPLALRFLAYLAIWLVMVGGGYSNILPGLVAAGLATWCSLVLMPLKPGPGRVRPLLMSSLLLRFVWGSVIAGLDIARLAFNPAMPLAPGWLVYRASLPRGLPRNLFTSAASLMPGSLCTGTDESGALIFHCLDSNQPVAEQIAAAERLLMAAMGVPPAAASAQGAGSTVRPQPL